MRAVRVDGLDEGRDGAVVGQDVKCGVWAGAIGDECGFHERTAETTRVAGVAVLHRFSGKG